MAEWFARFARVISDQCGHAYAFVLACAVVILWLLSGPVFAWSDSWQLVINTGTTVITFIMVFAIQNSQNRDTLAIQIKLDELIRASARASNWMEAIEELDEEQLRQLRQRWRANDDRPERR